MRLSAFVLAALLAAPLLPGTADAGPASERVFSTAALEMLKVGDQAIYSHIRAGTVGEELNPLENGEIRVTVHTGTDGSREAAVTMGEVGKLHPVSVWPAASGNPILPIFLESALRSMARTTGGSAFYIRNRIKDALGNAGEMKDIEVELDGATIPAVEITFEPFLNDKNRDWMGPFADMTLTFVVSDKMPGDIVRFVAATPPAADGSVGAFREEIAFRARATEAAK